MTQSIRKKIRQRLDAALRRHLPPPAVLADRTLRVLDWASKRPFVGPVANFVIWYVASAQPGPFAAWARSGRFPEPGEDWTPVITDLPLPMDLQNMRGGVDFGRFSGVEGVPLYQDSDNGQPRVTTTTPGVATVSSSGPELACSWRDRTFDDSISSLPRSDGKIVWELAGPMMFREHPLVQFAVMYVSGMEPDEAREFAKRVINEWHGLEPDAGLNGEYTAADLGQKH